MTTPDKEEMPTDMTAGNFWAEKRDGRWQLQMRHRGPGSSFCVAQINHWADNPEALTTRIADACNAYEPMREALAEMIYEATHLSPENPDGGHSCVISGLTLTKARDALSGFAAPTKSTAITDGLIEALKFYAGETIHGMAGDNGYRARTALSTLPVNDRQTSDDVGILRKATAAIEDDDLRNDLADICTQALADAPEVLADPRGLDVLLDAIVCLFRDKARAALKGVPQPASDKTPEMKRAAMTDARNVCELADTLREIEKQCIQADDPEHHTLSLVKYLARHALARLPQPASEAGKLSTDEAL